MANALSKLFGGSPQQTYGGGMAERAANTVSDENAYRKHVIDAQSEGETPMTREEFRKSRQDG